MMKFVLKNTLVACLLLSICNIANAGLIKVEDWHLTTDNFGGLKTSWNSPDIAFAVSKSTHFDETATYEAIDGWHFATYQEYADLTDIENTGGTTSSVYYSLGGWSGYEFEGNTRYLFKFEDSTFDNKYMFHAGGHEVNDWNAGSLYSQSHYTQNNLDNYFSGFIMVKGDAV
jgi:hypothetical protein